MVPPVLGQDLFQNGPCKHFGFRSHRGVSGAGRRQAREDVAILEQCRQDVTVKRLLRLVAVEEHMCDVWVLGEQGREIVGHLFGDRRV